MKSLSMFKLIWIAASMYVAGMCTGTFIESKYHVLVHVHESGLPKATIPATGSAVHMEATFPDGSFVAQYAGERLYYKAVDKNQKLIAGQPYEVENTKVQNGLQKSLVQIK